MKSILKFSSLILILGAVVFVSCKEDDPAPVVGDPIATFTYEISSENFLSVTFNSAGAQNAATYAWDFGDGAGTSTEANPTYVYSAEGSFTVSLIVKNSAGVESNNFTTEITIADPNTALKLLTGDVSKDWKLYRVGVALKVGPSAANPEGWYSGLNENGDRPCLFDDTWTFQFDGSVVYDDANTFWGEFGVWGSNAGENPLFEQCFEPTAANMTIDGTDVSAWGSGTHAFTYDVAAGELTLNGTGAWIVQPNLGTSAPHGITEFPATKTVPIAIEEFDGYDLMTVTFDQGDAAAGGSGFRQAIYVSYDDWADEPALIVAGECIPNTAVSPTIISHTFASNDAAEWNGMQFSDGNSGLTLGVDDPMDPTATKVGEFGRTADQYQELQFKLDPIADNTPINFENLTTITMDVYLPSSNDYTGGLNQNVFVGFGATKCPPDWFTDNIEYQATDVALDTWTTLTFTINAPDYVAVPGNGADPTARNDFDMIYISIGGNNHTDTGTFYMRNFKID